MHIANQATTNTEQIKSQDRTAVGNKPDETPVGGGTTGSGGGGGGGGVTGNKLLGAGTGAIIDSGAGKWFVTHNDCSEASTALTNSGGANSAGTRYVGQNMGVDL